MSRRTLYKVDQFARKRPAGWLPRLLFRLGLLKASELRRGR